MPINWQDGSTGGTPLSAANLNRLAVVADIGTTGTPTGDAVKAAAAAQVTDAKMASVLGAATASALASRAELKAAYVPVLTGRLSRARGIPTATPVMSSPPTITDGTSATITAQTVAPDSPAFVYNTPILRADLFGNPMVTGAPAAGVAPTAALTMAFCHDGQAFEILLRQYGGGDVQGATWRLKVDGQYKTLAATPFGGVNGDFRYFKVDFGSVGQRNIEIETQNTRLGAVSIGASDSILPIARPRSIRVGALGDSITAGTGASDNFQGWMNTCARLLGWGEIAQWSLGGTGYLNDGPGFLSDGTGTGVHLSAGGRIDAVIAAKPDVIVFAAGMNDTLNNGYTSAQLTAACLSSWQRARTALPQALIVVVNCWDIDASSIAGDLSNIAATQATIRTAAQAHPELVDVFVDPAGQIVNSHTSTRVFAGSSSPHPGPAGHDLYARWTAGAIGAALHAA